MRNRKGGRHEKGDSERKQKEDKMIRAEEGRAEERISRSAGGARCCSVGSKIRLLETADGHFHPAGSVLAGY